ncbi:MAG TPA: hypothetical protein VES42_21625 [Pilimelia sp.]|nr:hypothetical protein [Pilimelia sp.]
MSGQPQLTATERRTLKTAAYGAVYLVSHAEPGFFAMLRESFAASGVLRDSTGVVREALTRGGQPRLPKAPQEAVEAVVLPALRDSVGILRAKAPDDLEHFRDTVLTAASRVAGAAGGVHPAEAAALDKIRDALGR